MTAKRISDPTGGSSINKPELRACYRRRDMFLKSLGDRLRLLREAQNMKQPKVAELLDVSVSHIFNTEAGKNKPSLSLLEDFARLYRVDECDILTFPGEGIKHDLREEIRKIPTAQGAKLAGLLQILQDLATADDDTMVLAVEQVALLTAKPTRQRRQR